MRLKSVLRAICFLLLCFQQAAAGTKEEIIRLQTDVIALQNQVRTLQRILDENNAMLKSLLEQLIDRANKNGAALDSLRGELLNQQASLRGAIEGVLNETRAIRSHLEDTNTRLTVLAEQVSQARIQTESIRAPAAGPIGALGAQSSPDQLFKVAYSDYLQGKYDLAIKGFSDFLSSSPEGPLSDDAQYYLGDSLYNVKRLEEALAAFDRVVALYPGGDKVAPARLKKGLLLLELKRRAEAIAELRALIRDFPQSPEANIAREQLKALGVDAQQISARKRRR